MTGYYPFEVVYTNNKAQKDFVELTNPEDEVFVEELTSILETEIPKYQSIHDRGAYECEDPYFMDKSKNKGAHVGYFNTACKGITDEEQQNILKAVAANLEKDLG